VLLDLSIQAVSLLFGHAAKLHSCTSKGDKESVNNQGMNYELIHPYGSQYKTKYRIKTTDI
jgi:hypothetical protein